MIRRTLTRRAHLLLHTLALTGALVGAAAAHAETPKRGVLLLAHGGSPAWNTRVNALASQVDEQVAVEVAFGMASRPAIQAGVDKLVARGVTEIVAVPLFVSDHSSVITSTAYLLGLRREMPEDLKMFARMDHGAHGAGHGAKAAEGSAKDPHAQHRSPASAAASAPDGTQPIVSPVPVRMTAALGRHEVVGEILAARARAISTAAAGEAVILVAHGPVNDAENDLWLADMAAAAARVEASAPYASVDYLTVRDDAPKEIREAATAELRALVQARSAEGRRVLIVPLLMSFGGIEQGIRKRLDGLEYTMTTQGLTPDDRLTGWVLDMARTSSAAHSSR